MPVQINEVIIKAVVDTAPAPGSNQQAGNSSGNIRIQDAEIMEKILEIIREKQER